jgi:hypothetical protein
VVIVVVVVVTGQLVPAHAGMPPVGTGLKVMRADDMNGDIS